MAEPAKKAPVPGEWKESFFPAPDALRLFHTSLVPPSPKAVVIVVHGYGDHAGRYRHVMEAIAEAGYAAHALDYRGHGKAGGRRAYVAAFSDYLGDLSAFITRVKAESAGLPIFIVAHSHGALMTATLLSGADTHGISGVVLSSPYFRLRIKPSAFQLFQAKVVGKIIPFLPVKNPLKSDMLTHDAGFQKSTDADPLYLHVVTPKWFTESNAAQDALKTSASKFKVPLLVMPGGEDPIAHPDGAREFFAAAGSTDKKLIVQDGMFHEIFNEVDRAKPIGEMLSWIGAHLPKEKM